MKLDEYFVWATVRVLGAAGAARLKILDRLGQRYVLDRLVEPGRYSLGARTLRGDPSFLDWIGGLGTSAEWSVQYVAGQPAAAWTAGFSGPSAGRLLLRQKDTVSAWQLVPQHSPPFLLEPEGLKSLIEAQRQPTPLWAALEAQVRDYWTDNGLPPLPDGGLPAWLLSASFQSEYGFLAEGLLATLQNLVQEQAEDFVVPAGLAASLEPDPWGPVEGSGPAPWILKAPEQGWVRYAWVEQAGQPAWPVEPASVRPQFAAALEALRRFALAGESPFHEAFGLALHFLQAGTAPFPGREQLKAAGFSDFACDQAAGQAELAQTVLDWGQTTGAANDLLALVFSDVFGGMGSWNDDAGLGDPEGQARLGQELFAVRQLFWSEVLNRPQT